MSACENKGVFCHQQGKSTSVMHNVENKKKHGIMTGSCSVTHSCIFR